MFSVINRSSSRLRLSKKFIFISNETKLRHTKSLVKFSYVFHHISTNTLTISSVCIPPSAVAHTKNFNCWIDRDIFKSNNPYRNYHKCITSDHCISANYNSRRFVSIENSKKMVWICDLDNPQVNYFLLLSQIESFFLLQTDIDQRVT